MKLAWKWGLSLNVTRHIPKHLFTSLVNVRVGPLGNANPAFKA